MLFGKAGQKRKGLACIFRQLNEMACRELAVVGLQWGDEGKGKIVDWLCSDVDYAVRFQGGNNAGHTIIINGKRSVLHLIPSGIFHEQVTCLIGQGVVLDPWQVLEETDKLEREEVNTRERLFISGNCSLILPHHVAVDEARERRTEGIGTTKRGIGPAHEDKVGRRALRLNDLFSDTLEEKLARLAEFHNHMLSEMYAATPISHKQVLDDLGRIADRLRPLVSDIPAMLAKAKEENRKVLLEGAQGALLDHEHGTYPFVTSSSCLVSASVAGTGVSMNPTVIGVAKAYATRVGNGPFPTELNDENGKTLLTLGNEFGATTGRQRRCGWLDLPALRYALQLNGCRHICLTKLDVLDSLDEIKLCVSYTVDGDVTDRFPVEALERPGTKPVYETLQGWKQPTSDLHSFEDFPQKLKDFVRHVEEFTGASVSMASVGAERSQTIIRESDGFLQALQPAP